MKSSPNPSKQPLVRTKLLVRPSGHSHASLISEHPFLDYVLQNFDRIIFDMKLAELNATINKAVEENRYLEAFIVKSLYIEGLVTVLAIAIQAHEKGFDGKVRKLFDEIETEKDSKDFYENKIKDRLDEKIKVLRLLKKIDSKHIDYLYSWKDIYRDKIFHNFGELMLHPGVIEEECKKGYEFVKRFTEQPWFKSLEESLIETETWVEEKIKKDKN